MNKYILQKSSTRPNGWVLTDRENGIVITFDEGLFNESQNVTPFEDVSHTPHESELHLVRTKAPRWRLVLNRGEFDNIKLATSLRKAAEFLTKKVR